ncbi:MAG: FAD-binding oxidoreductase [Rhodospirillales bacterium]
MNDLNDINRRFDALLGPQGWLTDPDARSPYEHEARGYWSGACIGVARPTDTLQVAETVKLAVESGVPIVPQSGNTGLVAGGVPRGGIVLTTERMTRIRSTDKANMTMTVDAGCVLANIQQAAADIGTYFPLSLGAEGSCRIGGNISTNAGGVAVLRYGNMRDLVLGLEVVLPDGRVWDGLRGLRKDNTGYDLKQLFIGAEGTLGIVTGAVIKLFPAIRETVAALVGVRSWDDAIALLNQLRAGSGDALSACEAMSAGALNLVLAHTEDVQAPFERIPPITLLFELTSPRSGTTLMTLAEEELATALESGLAVDAVVAQSEAQRTAFWRMREAIPQVQSKAGGSIKFDVSVPISAIPAFVDKANRYVEKRIPDTRFVTFGHVGDGNLHYNLSQPESMEKDAFMALWDEVTSDIHAIAMSFAGSFSAEHGIGEIKRGDLIRHRSDVEIDLMRIVKRGLDPQNLMNPGKILPD